MIWGVEQYFGDSKDNPDIDSDQEVPALTENDFIKLINLEERYYYFKSLIKIQRLNNYKQAHNQKSMLKLMMQLTDYYSQCINEVEMNMNNIRKYFQQKAQDINSHYQQVVGQTKKGDHSVKIIEVPKAALELGNIETCIISTEELEESNGDGSEEKSIKCKSIKTNLNKNLMMALQNQNIQEHIAHSNKKADFFRKSIASSIKIQEELLEKRRKASKYKKTLKISQMDQTMTFFSPHESKSGNRRKKLQFQDQSDNLSLGSSLDEAQSQYIQSFIIEKEVGLNKSMLDRPA